MIARGKLIELKRVVDWTFEHSASGQPCDNCHLPLKEDEQPTIATAKAGGGYLLFVLCKQCKDAPVPNVLKYIENFASRLISAETEALVWPSQRMVN